MALFYETMRRLDVRGPASRGIVVDAEGAMLGPSCTLVQRTAAGYRCVRPAAAAAIQKAVFSAEDEDPDRLFILSRGIAKALNDGELALAQIYGLRIPIAGLDSGQLRKLSAAAMWVKANFNPDEPRIPAGEPGAGEWTYGGDDEGSEAADSSEPGTPPSGGAPAAIPVGTTATFDATDETATSIFEPGTPPGDGVPAAVAVGRTTTTAATAETAASIFGPLGRTALAALDALAADMAGPVAFLGVLFLPTNSSLISEGAVPGRPDLLYRYDQDTGVLDIYSQDGAGRQLVASGRIGPDGLFHAPAGGVLGRGLGSTVLVDPAALPAPLGRTGAAAQSTTDRPQLCPDPTPENTAGRSERAIAYQQQITGLPPGLEVRLNTVGFDGCRETDGTMLEAKGPGYADKMTGDTTWQDWFTGDEEIEAQMRRQAGAASGRIVEWHFAEQAVADYFRNYAERSELTNTIVIYTPADQP